jgi:hypothetical protein
MKSKNIILAIIFLGFTFITNAQPLPPTTPLGNPVPVGNLLGLLPLALVALGLIKLKKRKNNN